MEKSKKIIIAVVAVILIAAIIVAIVVIANKKKDDDKLKIESSADLERLVEQMYEGNENLPDLQTTVVDVKEKYVVQAATGLENGDDLEYLVVSEPLMNAQAYSLVLAKVKDGVDANKIAEDMSKSVNMRKWICVSADILYATNSNDVVCLIMSSEEWAKPVYEKFKEIAGTVGKEYEQKENIDFPEEMF